MLIILLCVIGLIVAEIGKMGHSQWNTPDWVDVVRIASIIIGIVVMIFMIINPIVVKANIVKFQSVKNSVETARLNGESFENAAMQLEIIEINQWLAQIQYCNGLFIIGDFVPDEVDDLEPIR